MNSLDRAVDQLRGRSRILVFTGAGISTESGIPDFRGPNGLWKTTDPSEFTIRRYLDDSEFRKTVWERRFTSNLDSRRPNPAHRAVVRLWQAGRMIGCITQNIDGLHLKAGLPPEATAELHGNARGIVCFDHGHPVDKSAVESMWRGGDPDPRCPSCGSILKSTTVLFGEMLPERAVAAASEWADGADAALAVGSTLSVYPAAGFPLEVAGRGEPLVIVNQGRTDQDDMSTVRVDGKAGEVLPELVSRLTGPD